MRKLLCSVFFFITKVRNYLLTFHHRFAVVFIAMHNKTVYNKLYNRQNLSHTFRKGSEYLVKKTK